MCDLLDPITVATMDVLGKIDSLRRSAVFSAMPDNVLKELADICMSRTYHHDQLLWYQGDPGDYLVVITRGLVKITVTSDNGDEMVLTTLGPHEVVGDLSLVDQGPRSASVVALTETQCLVLPRMAMIALMQRRPELLDSLLRALGVMLRRLTEQTTDLVFLDLAARIAKRLVREAGRRLADSDAGITINLGLTQTELAQMVGATRPAVNRVLQAMVARGLIAVQGRNIVIRDPGWPTSTSQQMTGDEPHSLLPRLQCDFTSDSTSVSSKTATFGDLASRVGGSCQPAANMRGLPTAQGQHEAPATRAIRPNLPTQDTHRNLRRGAEPSPYTVDAECPHCACPLSDAWPTDSMPATGGAA